jgi:hypothetical protein
MLWCNNHRSTIFWVCWSSCVGCFTSPLDNTGRVLQIGYHHLLLLPLPFDKEFILFSETSQLHTTGNTAWKWNIGKRLWISSWQYPVLLPITVAARSQAWTIFARSNAVIVGSNPIRGLDVYVCLFCVCVVPCVASGLAKGWSPVQGVLPTVYRIRKVKKQPRSNKGL